MSEANTALSIALTSISESAASILDAVAGHRAQAVERGFSPTAAEQMAVVYHSMLVSIVLHGLTHSPPPA